MIRLVVLGILVALLAVPATASATDYKVTTTDDHEDKACDADCTLREAVTAAGSADSVIVPKGVYTLQLGELLLVSDHIVGEGARAVFIDGARETRLMRVADGSTTIAGVTLRNGNGQSDASPGFGGAVLVQAGGTLTLTNSTVSGSSATNGGGLAAAGGLALIGSTVSGNDAATGRLTRGGGIYATSTLLLGNTTISGNTARDSTGGMSSEGGGVWAGGALLSQNVTIAGNTASSAGGIYLAAPQSGTQQISNTIVGANAGGACGGPGLSADTTRNNIGFDTTCLFMGVADRNSLNPILGALADNGGDTDTHALAPNSQAINQGATCATTDQRGVARPQPAGGVCDIGAYEYRAPVLTVVTNVLNDAGGTRAPSGFRVHVRQGGSDVTGSPQDGSDKGTPYSLVAGSSYTVAADAVSGYTLSYGRDCFITLVEGDARTCTVTANDIPPTLKVTTAVTNNDGGTRTPASFNVHVRSGGADVTGSPAPGSAAGTTYTLVAGTFTVSVDAVSGYAITVSGDCAANGSVALAAGENKTCTITADDGAPTLDVITQVINDDGGTRPATDFSVHVREGSTDVFGSPQAGSATGTTYSIPADTYTVAIGAMPGYTMSIAGDCDGSGSVALDVGQAKSCTVTANDVAPRLTVITTVTNDSGGTRAASGFSVHVRKGAADVSGSPQPGSASGTTYTLAAGSYAVGADVVSGYATAVGGACAANGSVTLAVGDAKTCTVTPNDNAIVQSQALPPPVPGRNVNALPKSGTVRVKLPGSTSYVRLSKDEQIPLGTIVDARRGRVTIVSTADGEHADFYGGIFKLGQTKGSKPITVVKLVGKLSCAKEKKHKSEASAAAKKKRKRRLWGNGKGRFRTKGRHSAATVVGTKWLVEDRCKSTLTRVVRGKVRVRDFRKKKTVLVKAGKKYVARARR